MGFFSFKSFTMRPGLKRTGHPIVSNCLVVPQVKVLLDNVVQLSAALGTGAVVKDGH